MHTIHFIATQAIGKDEAHRSVKSNLESHLGSEEFPSDVWYDWFVTGGGRWASGDDNQYNDEWTGDVAHQSEPAFQEHIDKAHKFYMTELGETIEQARKINLTDILDNINNDKESMYPNFKLSFELYPLHKLWSQIASNWGPDSYFYDIVNHTTHPTYMREAIDKGDTNWYIVPVDFHF